MDIARNATGIVHHQVLVAGRRPGNLIGEQDEFAALVSTTHGGIDVDMGFWRLAARDRGAEVLYTPADGRRIDAGTLSDRSHQIGRGLQSLGINPGENIAVLMPNVVEMIELYLAALEVGIRITPINFHLVAPEVAYIVSDCEAKAFVAHERYADVARAAADEAGVPADRRFAVGTIEGFRPYADLSDGQSTEPPEGRTTGAAMHYTSGTTGKPKGVKRMLFEIDPDDMGAILTFMQQMFGVTPLEANVYLSASPLYHTAPLMWTGAALHMGHRVVLCEKWDPIEQLQLTQDERITYSHMVPTQFNRILQAVPADQRQDWDVSSLRCIVHAAAPCPPETKRQMIEWWGVDVIGEYYAATEGGGTFITGAEWLERPGSVGRPWAGYEVKILDDDHVEQPAGVEGTVYMSLTAADFEYKGDAEKTSTNRWNGFFTVGDWGYKDDEGYLFLCDRKSDMIISGGVNIYPAEIEGAISAVAGVGDVAVFGIPHDDWGEEIKAVVEPAAGVEPDDALRAAIMEYLQANLAKFKHPKSIDFVAALPRDPSGKLFKRRLRDPYWADRESRI